MLFFIGQEQEVFLIDRGMVWMRLIDSFALIDGKECGLFREAVKTARYPYRGGTRMSFVDLLLINVA